jgi:hypothetical protein
MSRSRRKAPPHVLVVWEDAAFKMDAADLTGTSLAVVSGWLVEATEKHLKIVSEIHADGDRRQATVIPAGMVRAVITQRVKLPVEFASWYEKADP